jgi:hypothetical protein
MFLKKKPVWAEAKKLLINNEMTCDSCGHKNAYNDICHFGGTHCVPRSRTCKNHEYYCSKKLDELGL